MANEPETQTPETTALANLIDREAMLAAYGVDLAQISAKCDQKLAEWNNLRAKADAIIELRDEARDTANALGGQKQVLEQLIAYHSKEASLE